MAHLSPCPEITITDQEQNRSGGRTVIVRVGGVATQRLYFGPQFGNLYQIDILAGDNLRIIRTERVSS